VATQVFVSYRRVEPDASLANGLAAYLERRGLRVFLDNKTEVGLDWAAEIDRQLRTSSAFVVFLSEASIRSDMVRHEVEIAHQLREAGKIAIFPVRLALDGALPFDLAAYLHRIQWAGWSPGDPTEAVWAQLHGAIAGGTPLPSSTEPGFAAPPAPGPGKATAVPEPAPAAELRPVLETGTISPDSHFYVRRRADSAVEACLAQKHGSTVVLKGPRQSGKSSLLARLHAFAKRERLRSVYVDFQVFDASQLASLGGALRSLAERIARAIPTTVRPAAVWDSDLLGDKESFGAFLVSAALDPSLPPLVLLLDEVDRIFGEPYRDDFFAAVRAWHNLRAIEDAWQGLHLVLAHATEPALWIENLNQSPFNVGERLRLGDFSREEVADLETRHGGPLHGSAEIDGLMRLLGGHPYLVRQALYALVTERWSLAELETVAARDDGPFGDHLRRHLWSVGRSAELRTELARVVRGRGCSDEGIFQRLLAAGLVEGETRATARMRCSLYQTYFARHL
jgi:nitroreductase